MRMAVETFWPLAKCVSTSELCQEFAIAWTEAMTKSGFLEGEVI